MSDSRPGCAAGSRTAIRPKTRRSGHGVALGLAEGAIRIGLRNFDHATKLNLMTQLIAVFVLSGTQAIDDVGLQTLSNRIRGLTSIIHVPVSWMGKSLALCRSLIVPCVLGIVPSVWEELAVSAQIQHIGALAIHREYYRTPSGICEQRVTISQCYLQASNRIMPEQVG